MRGVYLHTSIKGCTMQQGYVVRWNSERQYGIVKPNDGGATVFVHFNDRRPPLGRRITIPEPRIGDAIDYELNLRATRPQASLWSYANRLNTLTLAQQDLVRRVLGPYAGEFAIWDVMQDDEPPVQWQGQEWYGAVIKGPGTRGTFHQVLLWAWYYIAERNHEGLPKLVPWPDMPHYSVRVRTDGQWQPNGLVLYTWAQANGYGRHLVQRGHYSEAKVWDLAPGFVYSVGEVAKVLAKCQCDVGRDAQIGGSEVTWFNDSRRQGDAVVAEGRFGSHSWVSFNGQTFLGDEARLLEHCGMVADMAVM
jgi:cold shock CspA family protein